MLDQNIAIIIAALIGGLLTITGGIVANFYLSNRAVELEKRRETRNVIEELYECLSRNNTAINSIRVDKSIINIELINLNERMDRILILIDLYAPSLNKEYDALLNSTRKLHRIYIGFREDKIDLKEYISGTE